MAGTSVKDKDTHSTIRRILTWSSLVLIILLIFYYIWAAFIHQAH